MSDEGVAPMHQDFPSWYKTVDLEQNTNRLHSRWKGIASLAQSVSDQLVECMVRVVFRTKQVPSPDGLSKIRQCFAMRTSSSPWKATIENSKSSADRR